MIKSPDLSSLCAPTTIPLFPKGHRANRDCKAIGSRTKAVFAAARVAVTALAAMIALASCQSVKPKTAGPVQTVRAVPALQRVNARGFDCWIKSGDSAFKKLALVPELDTRAGTPRILVVERGKPQGLPKLVIESAGRGVATYGELAGTAVGARIRRDAARWANGGDACQATV
jgi:hypothetical protein